MRIMNGQLKSVNAIQKFSVGSVLGCTFRTLRQNPVVYFGLSFLAVVLSIIPRLIFDDTFGTFGSFFIFVFPHVADMAIQGSIAYAVYLGMKGQTATINNALQQSIHRLHVIIPASAVVLIFIIMGIFVSIAVFIGISGFFFPVIDFFSKIVGTKVSVFFFTTIAASMFTFTCFIIASMYLVTVHACVIEKLGINAALKRSIDLTDGYCLQIFLLLFIAFLTSSMVTGGVSFVTTLITWERAVLEKIAVSLFSLAFTAFTCVMYSIIYYNLRTAKEGASLDNLAKMFD